MMSVFAVTIATLLLPTFAWAAGDTCDYTSRDWSAMRATLVAVSRFRGKSEANVQQIAREALAGSKDFSIGEFGLRYVRGASGGSVPNDAVCFP
jgi:hypothetical protein